MARVLKTLIADDEEIGRKVLREEIELLPELTIVGEAANGAEALRQIRELQPDLVFLDIQMPLMGGLEVVRNLNGSHLPVIVIVTAYQEHAIDAFESGAVDYLLKPVSSARLKRAVERACKLANKPLDVAENLAKIASTPESGRSSTPRKLVGRTGRDYFLLDIDEVLAVQVERELVWLVTAERRFLSSQPLRTLEAALRNSPFQRVHRNALVNVNHVRKISPVTSRRWILTLSNDTQLVVSKRQVHNIRQLLTQ
ncbi:MAG TPA: LytTR family DNA-binding domain-containing protein [Bryobacteraceae bacterium]|nr:LytTR family DNA-binding domain-containing protein [Bryobacteraceae bacterium]